MLALEESAEKINLGDFKEVERLANGVLPREFKSLYMKNNGGYPSVTEFDGAELRFSINGFNSIKHGRPSIEMLISSFYCNYESIWGLVPFAYDDGGNTFMLSIKLADYGKVYLWLHEEEILEFVVLSFDEFLKSVARG